MSILSGIRKKDLWFSPNKETFQEIGKIVKNKLSSDYEAESLLTFTQYATQLATVSQSDIIRQKERERIQTKLVSSNQVAQELCQRNIDISVQKNQVEEQFEQTKAALDLANEQVKLETRNALVARNRAESERAAKEALAALIRQVQRGELPIEDLNAVDVTAIISPGHSGPSEPK